MRGTFQTTQWTLILQAADSRSEEGAASLERLCRSYWPPLYAFARGLGKPHQDAQDLTQAFFEQMVADQLHKLAEPSRGRFRSWLLKLFKNFMTNAHRHANAQKRGGGAKEILSLDEVKDELPDHGTPDRDYERKWAHTVLANAMERLRLDCEGRGQAERYRVLQHFIFEDPAGPGVTQAEADELGTTLNAARITLTRLRQRYRELLRLEVARLVSDPDEVDDELLHLMRSLG